MTWLILLSTAVGFHFGLSSRWSDLAAAIYAVAGTGLMAAGTLALNQWYERHADAKMQRTARRPIPTGRVSPGGALACGACLSFAGFFALALGANPLCGFPGAATLLSYLFAYTPLKQRSTLCTLVGAFPGAMPPLIGFAGARGVLTAEAWALFAILFLWQFPHFTAIAWIYRADYARAGILMLPVTHSDGTAAARQVVLGALALVPVSIVPTMLHMSGAVYLIGALVLGLAYLYSAMRLARERTAARARSVLLASVVYLPLVYGLMLVDTPR